MKRFLFILTVALTLVSVFSVDARKKPLIGIAPGYSGASVSTLGRAYSDAIIRAGGIPVILPQVNNASMASEMLGRVDGFMLTGGVDLNPAYSIDLLYAKAALKSRKPILAICRGEQLLNVVLGGSLFQDLPTQKPGDVTHRQKTDSRFPTHSIILEENSRLFEIMGRRKSLEVNSLHHQAVKVLSDKVELAAYSPDGVVEAYEGTDKRQWLLAVQFHPEQLVRADESWLALFMAFVKACR